MTPLLYYLFKVVICSGIFFLYYHLLLRNKIFHQWNRFYLLITSVLSLIIPLLQFTLFHKAEEEGAVVKILKTVNSANTYFEGNYLSKGQNITVDQWILFVYFLISVSFLLTFIWSLVRIVFIIKNNRVQIIENIKFISTEAKGTPFSFLKYIFWNKKIELQSNTGQQIFKHELVHIKEHHTLDKIFLQIILVLFWINPFFWLVRREIRLIHEFIADKKSVEHQDLAVFAAMVLQTVYPGRVNYLTNQFFHNSIKRRIQMLSKLQNPRINYASRIIALPIIAITVLAFTLRTRSVQILNQHLAEPLTVVIDAGHGMMSDGNKTGASSNGLYEDDIVLSIAKQVKELNSNKQIKILLTRNDQHIIDLQKRVDVAKENNADLFISLHLNGNPLDNEEVNQKKAGNNFDIYVSSKNTPFQIQSELLGSLLHHELGSVHNISPALLKRSIKISVLDKNFCPSVLLECGYLTNMKDREFITNKENQNAIAEKILMAIEKFGIQKNQLKNTNPIDTIPKAADDFVNLRTITLKEAKKLDVITIMDEKLIGNISKLKLDEKNILTIALGSGNPLVKKYGKAAENGVIIIITKKVSNESKEVKTEPVFEKAETPPSIDKIIWRKFLEGSYGQMIDELVQSGAVGTFTTYFKFIVNTDGSLSDIQALNDPGYGLVDKLMKLLAKSPKWNPATQNGHLVRSYYIRPIMFVVDDGSSNPLNTSQNFYNPEDIKKFTIHQLADMPADIDIVSCILTINTDKGDLVVVTNEGNTLKEKGKQMLSTASKGKTLMVDAIVIKKNGNEIKMPAKIYRM